MIELWKVLQTTRNSIYETLVSDHKTIIAAAKSCNDSITSEIKKVLGPLAAVTNPDVQAELLLVLAAVSKWNILVLFGCSVTHLFSYFRQSS